MQLKPILPPKDYPSARKARAAIELALDIAATVGVQELRGATRRWKHSVAFRIEKSREGRSVVTDDPVFLYQDQGTRAHSIRPRKARVLRFPGRSGMVYTKHVNHPGTPAQHFTEKAAAKMQAQFARIVQERLSQL